MRRKRIIYLFLLLLLLFSIIGCKPSPPDPFKERVKKADLIVLGTIINKEYIDYEVFYTLSIEKVIKGDSKIKEVVFTKYFEFQNDYLYNITDKILICLQKTTDYIYKSLKGGELWIFGSFISDFNNDEAICRVIKIMKQNKIPISLPVSEIKRIEKLK